MEDVIIVITQDNYYRFFHPFKTYSNSDIRLLSRKYVVRTIHLRNLTLV